MTSHHDSRMSRANRGDTEFAAEDSTAARRRRVAGSFLLKNMDLQNRLHVANYTRAGAAPESGASDAAAGWRTGRRPHIK
jgi:hypothetical protein